MEVRIDGWQKGIRFSSAHLTADLGKCERLHGHSYAIHCQIVGDQDPKDRIVHDFVEVTRALKEIAEELDHYVLVPANSGPYRVDRADGALTLRFAGKSYSFPEADCYQLPTPSTTAEDLSEHVMTQFRQRVKLAPTVRRILIGVDEGYGQGAWSQWTPTGG